MQYGELAGVHKRVSRLVQGTMMLNSEELEASFALLDAVYQNGCTAFDTAHVYGGGDCERVLGQWMEERGNRDELMVIGKGAHFNEDRNRVTPFDIAADLHDTLARLRTDYVDLYLLHRDDPDVELGPVVEALNEHRQAGRIRAFGGSNWTHERIAEANAYASGRRLTGFAASSPNFSLIEMVEPIWPGCVAIGGPNEAAARAWYIDNSIPVFSWSSLARGFLSGRYTREAIEAMQEDAEEISVPAFRSEANLTRLDRAGELARKHGVTVPQIGLVYLFHQPVDVYPLVGCQTPDEWRANAEALDITLTQEELAWVNLEEC